MLEKIKSVLTRTPPAFPPASVADTVRAQVDLKQKQLRRGTTEKQVIRFTADVDASQRVVEQARHTLGERRVEGVDTAATTEALRQAEGQLREDQAALTVAKQKDDEAQRALKDAERQTAIAADDEVLTAFKDSILELEGLLFGEMKEKADKVGATFAVVKDRSEGDPGVASSLRDFLLWFPVYRDRACAALIPSGRTYSKTLDEDKKPLSAWADNVAYAMASRRKGR